MFGQCTHTQNVCVRFTEVAGGQLLIDIWLIVISQRWTTELKTDD